jgi:uncharacterized membrane protein YfhO
MLLANTNVIYGIKDFRVINPLLPKRYTDFMMQSGGVRQGLSVFVWGAWNLGPELDLASVKYIVVQEPHVELPTSRFRFLQRFNGNLKVYENLKALPESYLAYSTVESDSFEQSLKLIRSKNFDESKQVIIEPNSEISKTTNAATVSAAAVRPDYGFINAPIAKKAPAGVVRPIEAVPLVTRPDSETVKIKFNAKRSGVLVLTDTFYPGWTAKLDGKDTDILAVNGMFRGVRVPQGSHELVYEFKSEALETGLKLLLAGLASLLVLAIAQVIRLLIERSNSKRNARDY